MTAQTRLNREEIIAWLRDRQGRWMTPNYTYAANIIEGQVARIAELEAEVERLKRYKITLQNNFEKVFEHAATARNDALEEAAKAVEGTNEVNRRRVSSAIRALKREARQ